MYLQICSDYIDFLFFLSLTVRDRLALASKVSFFPRIWNLWLKFVDHSVGSNTKSLTVHESFVSNQFFLDVQISFHFVVLFIQYFRDFYNHLPIPLHLMGFDTCEIFFSKVDGMQGMEKAYDFHELVNCANTLNHLAAIEYDDNMLQFGQVHNKGELHLLKEGEVATDLGDYTKLSETDKLVSALQKGLREAQILLHILNMAPLTVAREKMWFIQPWKVECEDQKFWAYLPAKKVTVGEDGNGEVLREAMATPAAILEMVSIGGE